MLYCNTKPTLIGLCGRKRSGKTTAAEILVEELGYAHLSFAEPIRRAVADILAVSRAELEAIKEDAIDWLDGRTPRDMMQTMGTEWGRDRVHPELWVRKCMRDASAFRERGKPVVISDVRFDNEAWAIRDAGGIVIDISREKADRVDHRKWWQKLLGRAEHASERGVSEHAIDYRVFNVNDIAWLKQELLRAVATGEREIGDTRDIIQDISR